MKFFIISILLTGCFFDQFQCYTNPPSTVAARRQTPPSIVAARRQTIRPMAPGAATTRRPMEAPTRRPVVAAGTLDANVYCFDCLMRVNNRDLFANPVDCHTYFQCLYLNETNAIGILKRCQAGTFFDETRLTCRSEGTVPCQPSPCLDPTIARIGCYQLPGQSCREYYTCQFNETRCCPIDTRFDPNTCSCLPDATCTDFCLALPQVTPPPTSNETACTDSFGNTLLPVPGRPDLFQLGDFTLSCALGTMFNLTECACTTPVNITGLFRTTGPRQCKLWLPFDTDLMDKSVDEFTTFAYGNAELDNTTSATGNGGSLLVNDGRLEIPGMKTMELNNPLGSSICFSFRCSTTSPYTCATNGGILSNSRDGTASVFTIIAAISGSDTLLTQVRTENVTIVDIASLTGPVNTPTVGWNAACLIYSNDTANLYVNGVLRATSPLTGPLAVTHCPYVLGNDQYYGGFIGNIDNVLVCDTPLTTNEIEAHYTGDTFALAAAGLIP